jgi:hypothetical protein
VERPSQRRFGIDHAIIRVMAWFSVGVLGSLAVAAIHAAVRPVQPVLRTIAPNISASRFALRDENSMTLEWYVMLGGHRPVYAEDYGWPVPAWSVWHAQTAGGGWNLIAGVPLSRVGTRPGIMTAASPTWAIPVVPRLPLLALAAAAYGLVGYGCWRLFRHFRATRRRRRGLCARCGYGPWTGGIACPECGATVRVRSNSHRLWYVNREKARAL